MQKKIIDYEILDRKNEKFDKNSIDIEKEEKSYNEINILPREQTVEIFIKYEDGSNETRRYGYIEPKEIYKKIHKGEPINLNYCYVKGFSASEYKKIYNEECKIKSLAAVGAFFCDENEIDFSSVIFLGDKIENHNPKFTSNNVSVDFSDSIFISKEVSFKSSKFMNEGVNFSRTKFISDILSFWSTGFLNNYTFFFQIEHYGDKTHFQQSAWNSSLKFNNNFLYSKKINFYNTHFKGNFTQFDVNYCEGQVNFLGANFSKTELIFNSGKYKKSINFSYVTISNDLNMKFDYCNGVILSNMFIKNYFYIKNINKKLNLEDTKILGQLYIDWEKENVKKLIEEYYNDKLKKLDKLKKNYVELDKEILDNKIKEIIDYTNKYGIEKHKKNLLENLQKMNKKNFIRKIKSFMKNNYYQEKADQFRLLKENYRKLGQYEWEDKAYYEFKKNKIRTRSDRYLNNIDKINQKENKNIKDYIKVPLLFIKYYFSYLWWECINVFIQEKIGKYGTSPGRIILSMFGTVVLFSFIYYCYKIDNNLIDIYLFLLYVFKIFIFYILLRVMFNFKQRFVQHKYDKIFINILFFLSIISILFYLKSQGFKVINNFNNILLFDFVNLKTSIYHSIITFLTIGYGKTSFTNISSDLNLIIISGVEGFLGLFLMSYFTVAFVRKVLR